MGNPEIQRAPPPHFCPPPPHPQEANIWKQLRGWGNKRESPHPPPFSSRGSKPTGWLREHGWGGVGFAKGGIAERELRAILDRSRGSPNSGSLSPPPPYFFFLIKVSAPAAFPRHARPACSIRVRHLGFFFFPPTGTSPGGDPRRGRDGEFESQSQGFCHRPRDRPPGLIPADPHGPRPLPLPRCLPASTGAPLVAEPRRLPSAFRLCASAAPGRRSQPGTWIGSGADS